MSSPEAPTRTQLYHWFHQYTSSPSLSLSPLNIRKTIYILRTHPDIAQSLPRALETFTFALGHNFGDLVKCPQALSDLSDLLGRLLELKGDPGCKKILKRGYVDQMEQITHHRIKNEKTRRAYERKKQSNSGWFIANRLEGQRREKREMARAMFEAVDQPARLVEDDCEDEEAVIQKKIRLAMFESPFQALDFADCIQIEVPPVSKMCEYRIETVPEPLPIATTRVPERLHTPRPIPDPRILRRIQAVGIGDILDCQELMKELPKLGLVLDFNLTLAEAIDRDRISELAVLIPSNAIVLKSCDKECFLIPRPGLTTFISKLARFCDISLHVSGLSGHISAISKAIDPDGVLLRGGVFESPEDCVTALDMDQTIVFSSRSSIWADGHLLQSQPFSLSKSCIESEFRLSALCEALYGAKEMQVAWAEDRDDSELMDIAAGLQAVYARFLANSGTHTFAYELVRYREGLFAGETVSFSVYEKSIGEPDYTAEKLGVYRFVARHLGAREEAGGVEVVEYSSQEKRFVAGAWLVKCFFRITKVDVE